ncbi:electron transfer flavoprotein beta subunit [Sporobacter termitidis DSM 10068]|uniref:Electron transfer flavoprotein small subunit n=1 Tax=Sporobacter termitidis DSM 10068 TaxID=1123282 RepID=A0A1M5XVF9_9FIRM|nr:electron transfer flavoprotein subunit beta/FixA family protein [Sporobacter termitidis]SHI03790.1 electron transfer flavoprotein beta subunit [Sporobacter termitidis DSM 10068]
MNILVCIKQVPDTTEIRIDPNTNTLIRAGVPSIVNTFDTYALETAVKIKDADPGAKIVVATMGPEQAKEALKTCLSVGADKAYLASDRAFGGSDTLATSYVLSCVVKELEKREGAPFDLIFCGKQAIDGDTGQVGPELAKHLDYPQITNALEVTPEGGKIRARRETEDGYEVLEASLPVVVTVTKTAYEPRYASVKSKMAANRAVITVLTAADFAIDTERTGLKGSPTKVKKTFVPQRKKGGVKLQEETGVLAAEKLTAFLSDAGVI